MAYAAMSTEVFQNANVSILACQLFIMTISLIVVLVSNRSPRIKSVAPGGKL